MNQLMSQDSLTMSTREIANLLGKQHSNIKVSAERLAKNGTIALQGSKFEHNGIIYEEYLLDKRSSLILVAQNCPEFTAAIVDRWQELEAGHAPKIPQTYAEALRLAADQAVELEKKEAQLAIAAPKAEFVDRYVESTGLSGFRQVAKMLRAKEPELRAFLVESKILYKLGGGWTAYQNHIDAGRFAAVTGTANDHAYHDIKFTAKGVEWIASMWAVHQIRHADLFA